MRLGGVAGGGEGRWGSHGHMSEIVVWSGAFKVEVKDHTLELGPGQCRVVPVGAEHRGTSRHGAECCGRACDALTAAHESNWSRRSSDP